MIDPFEDIFKDEEFSYENIDPKRISKLDRDLTLLFMDPEKPVESNTWVVNYTKEVMEQKIKRLREMLNDYNKNELAVLIFQQKLQFFVRIAKFGDYINKLKNGEDPDEQ